MNTDRSQLLLDALAERILVIGGPYGTYVHGRNLSAADFGGPDHEGCNEQLNVTPPDIVADAHRATSKSTGRLRPGPPLSCGRTDGRRVTGDAMSDALLVKLGRFGVRLPRPLWKWIMAREAQRYARGIAWVTPEHHRVRDFAVSEIARTGEPMSPGRIATATGIAADRVAEIIDELERGMVFLFRTDGANVDWAYPFTATTTPHRVTLVPGEPRYAA
jgi:hypothetical protein